MAKGGGKVIAAVREAISDTIHELGFEIWDIEFKKIGADFHLTITIDSENGIDMKKGKRKNRFLLYVKDSTQIEDFFAVIGANKLAFDLMNSKIVREVRGDANRQMNCDMANIKKTLSAAGKHIEMIEDLKEKGLFIRLPQDLRITAELRYENTQASMADLGLLHNPPISKSGVKHRLDKIEELYNEIINKQ